MSCDECVGCQFSVNSYQSHRRVGQGRFGPQAHHVPRGLVRDGGPAPKQAGPTRHPESPPPQRELSESVKICVICGSRLPSESATHQVSSVHRLRRFSQIRRTADHPFRDLDWATWGIRPITGVRDRHTSPCAALTVIPVFHQTRLIYTRHSWWFSRFSSESQSCGPDVSHPRLRHNVSERVMPVSWDCCGWSASRPWSQRTSRKRRPQRSTSLAISNRCSSDLVGSVMGRRSSAAAFVSTSVGQLCEAGNSVERSFPGRVPRAR